jgi:hypothetical protein
METARLTRTIVREARTRQIGHLLAIEGVLQRDYLKYFNEPRRVSLLSGSERQTIAKSK